MDYPPQYSEQVESLKLFLRDALKVHDDHVVSVYAFECPWVGGFRIAEISVHHGSGGCSWQRSEAESRCLSLILACEDYVRTFHLKPVRKEGFESDCDLDLFADAKWKLGQVCRATR